MTTPVPNPLRAATIALFTLLIAGTTVAAPSDDVLDRLRQLEDEFPDPVAAKTRAEKRIVRRARKTRAARLIAKSKRKRKDRRRYVRLRGSLERYAAGIAETKVRDVVAGFVACEKKAKAGRCVAVVGDSCHRQPGGCEGMHIAIVVRVAGKRVTLDRIVGGGFYVARNQDDIEDLRDVAP